uniref:Copper resistance B n=1 Tax=Caulobacter sp. (strain K31) TaxID=366602 RepID=B0SXH2_CAUSK
MKRLFMIATLPMAMAAPALAQSSDPHAGHHMPMQAAPADPHSGHTPPPPAPPASPPVDPHFGLTIQPAPAANDEAPPPIPTDHDADRYFPATAMAAARDQLAHEHGAIAWSKISIEKLEFRPGGGADGYAWEARASFGGDVNRLVVKSRGDGARELDKAEVEVLYGRAVTPYFNLEAGLRQDFEPHARSYLALGLDGVAPYGFDLNTALFLSDRGDLTVRAEAAHDLRLTQRLILEPRAEANLAAQDVPAQRIGAGLSSVELGLRLRYAITPEFAPYVGVNYERRFGETGRLAHAAGEDRADTRIVIGVRSWF